MESPGYYAIITARVRYDKNLCSNAKLLYGEISALTNTSGVCWAGNLYFANLYNVSVETISRWVSSLRDAGHITVEIDKAAGNTRKISLAYPIDEKINTYCAKDQEVLTKRSIAIDENVKSYIRKNITNNNTSNKQTPAQEETSFPETDTLLDNGFKTEVNETLTWLLNKKGVHKRNLPTVEWLNWFQDLEAEKLDLKSFRSFYEFCEQRDWIIQKKAGITPNVMRRELENFKKQRSINGSGSGKPQIDVKDCTECQGVGFTYYFDQTDQKEKAKICKHSILKQTFCTV